MVWEKKEETTVLLLSLKAVAATSQSLRWFLALYPDRDKWQAMVYGMSWQPLFRHVEVRAAGCLLHGSFLSGTDCTTNYLSPCTYALDLCSRCSLWAQSRALVMSSNVNTIQACEHVRHQRTKLKPTPSQLRHFGVGEKHYSYGLQWLVL